MITVHTDGGARGNPGPSAIGVVIDFSSGDRKTVGKFLGVATNNIAEYQAIIEAFNFLLKTVPSESRESVSFFLDSLLVKSQLSGEYKIKDIHLLEKAKLVKTLEKEWGRIVTYNHVRREQNKDADKIVNEVLDTARF